MPLILCVICLYPPSRARSCARRGWCRGVLGGFARSQEEEQCGSSKWTGTEHPPLCFNEMTCIGLKEDYESRRRLPNGGGASLEPSPGADMDGEGTPLSVGGGCEQRSRRGRVG